MTGKKITGRTKQLSLKSTPEFHQRLKLLASKEKCLMIEILEEAVAVWEIQRQKDLAKKMAKDTVPQVSPSHGRKRQMDDDAEELNNSFKKIKIGK